MRILNQALLCVSIAIVGAVSCATPENPAAPTPATGEGAITPGRRREAIDPIVLDKECRATIDDPGSSARSERKWPGWWKTAVAPVIGGSNSSLPSVEQRRRKERRSI
jgi:hypothetical protein